MKPDGAEATETTAGSVDASARRDGGGSTEIRSFVDGLSRMETGPHSVNFFAGSDEANLLRRRNLERYLQQMMRRRPRVMLLGEAPGYRGMRITGAPFTNRTVLERGVEQFELFGYERGYRSPQDLMAVSSEPTATVMWNVLTELDFLPLLWSAYPLHPHRPGDPLSNRAPTAAEVESGRPWWHALAAMFSIRSVIAVGNVAHRSAARGGDVLPKVRHPSHGGKLEFARGLRELLDDAIDE